MRPVVGGLYSATCASKSRTPRAEWTSIELAAPVGFPLGTPQSRRGTSGSHPQSIAMIELSRLPKPLVGGSNPSGRAKDPVTNLCPGCANFCLAAPAQLSKGAHCYAPGPTGRTHLDLRRPLPPRRLRLEVRSAHRATGRGRRRDPGQGPPGPGPGRRRRRAPYRVALAGLQECR